MQKIVMVPTERLEGLLQGFCPQTAVQVPGGGVDGSSLWQCDVRMESGEVWQAVYAGPHQEECWSYLCWRNVEINGVAYREGMGQFTVAAHERKGLASAVLEAALKFDLPLLSDREGLTFQAFKRWHKRALKGGAAVLDLTTGERYPVADFRWHELWNDEPDCERLQLVFDSAPFPPWGRRVPSAQRSRRCKPKAATGKSARGAARLPLKFRCGPTLSADQLSRSPTGCGAKANVDLAWGTTLL